MTLINLKTTAEMLGMHPETLRRKRAMGALRRLEFHQVGGGRLKVTKESVERELRDSVVEDPIVA